VASALINAATLALIDAGIEMNDMVSSCTVTLQDEDRVALDPTGVEEKAQRGSAVVAISPVRGNVTFVESSGTWEEQLWNDALKMAIVGCAQMDCTMREWLKSRPID
jgi:ribonuclease PH